MNPKTTAVVLIEYQNDFAAQGGVFHDAVKGVMLSNHMLLHTMEAVAAAREAGATIIHVPISFSSDYHELNQSPYGILKGVVDNKAFRKGTWGAEIINELKPRPEDIVIEGKRGLCGFQSTNLDFILRNKGIQTVAICGFLTNCCVESTMRTGYERGYQVYTLTDCLAATSEAEHENAIANDYPMFSRPVTSTEFAAALAGEQQTLSGSSRAEY